MQQGKGRILAAVLRHSVKTVVMGLCDSFTNVIFRIDKLVDFCAVCLHRVKL